VNVVVAAAEDIRVDGVTSLAVEIIEFKNDPKGEGKHHHGSNTKGMVGVVAAGTGEQPAYVKDGTPRYKCAYDKIVCKCPPLRHLLAARSPK
jgi:hypothetical protein